MSIKIENIECINSEDDYLNIFYTCGNSFIPFLYTISRSLHACFCLFIGIVNFKNKCINPQQSMELIDLPT